MTKILALDLGVHTGWALHDGCDVTASGVKAFDDDEHALRFGVFADWIRDMLDDHTPRLVAFEDVRHVGAGSDAAHHWGALYGLLLAECGRRGQRYLRVNVAAVKRAAGLGSAASKSAVVAAARARWPAWDGCHDEADARWVAVAAAARVAEAAPPAT